jgi:hypothetical protein
MFVFGVLGCGDPCGGGTDSWQRKVSSFPSTRSKGEALALRTRTGPYYCPPRPPIPIQVQKQNQKVRLKLDSNTSQQKSKIIRAGAQSSLSYSSRLLRAFGPSLRIGIFMPWVAKHLLRFVLSITPGNFFALKTWKTSEKVLASTGADPVFRLPPSPTLTKFILSLIYRREVLEGCDSEGTNLDVGIGGNMVPEGTFCPD